MIFRPSFESLNEGSQLRETCEKLNPKLSNLLGDSKAQDPSSEKEVEL
jgi:hypothetical protein